MVTDFDRRGAVRTLIPVNRLPPENQDAIVALGEFVTVPADQIVYAQGHSDTNVHYLLDGEVDFLRDGKVVRRLSSDSKAARRALDQAGNKRHTVKTRTTSLILSFPRREFDRQLEEGNLLIGPRLLEVSEIASEQSSNWMIKMLQSDLFSNLSAENIQRIFGRMERVDAQANEVVVKQGDPGDYYYVIERGYCEVSREIQNGKEIHLADLSPGDAFGEAALIADDARTASVTMLSDGTLMRLSKEDFDELVRAPLLTPIAAKTALLELERGAILLDTRYPEDCATSILRQSINVPANVLRLQAARLEPGKKYIVCGDEPTHCAVASFILLERGVNNDYLDVPIQQLIDDHPSVLDTKTSGSGSTDRVIEFPGASRTRSEPLSTERAKESRMDENRPEGQSLESTIEKIDRLYSQKEWEAEKAARVPVQDYAQTSTGQRLAELIDEINDRRDSLVGDESAADTTLGGAEGFSIDEVIDIAPTDTTGETVTPSVLLVDTRAPLPVSDDDTLHDEPLFSEDDDGLASMMKDFEYRVREHIETVAADRTHELERQYQDKLKRLRKAAALEVRKRQEQQKRKYEKRYKKKEIQLRAYYKKLMALANKISLQKAQLQVAKKQFEEKLSAANAVYKQVEDMRKTLREHIGDKPATSDPDKRQSA